MEKPVFNVSLLQPDTRWEDIQTNLQLLDEMAGEVPGQAHLLVLPETFSTGFTMNTGAQAEEPGTSLALEWMRKLAEKRQMIVTGSLIIRDNGRIYNRLYWITPGGGEKFYNKRHLFRMGKEDQFFTSGDAREIFTEGEFRFLPQVCYDLRFPVFARNRMDYDIMFYVANWPGPRQHVWETLLKARAMENQAYVIGVNRAGKDGEGFNYRGGSCVISPRGDCLAALGEEPGHLACTLNLEEVRSFREKFPAWKDADDFSLIQDG